MWTLQGGSLQRRTNRQHIFGIDTRRRRTPKQLGQRLLDPRHLRHATNQDRRIDIGVLNAHLTGQRALAQLQRAVDQVLGQLLELGAGDASAQVQRISWVPIEMIKNGT